MSLAVVEAKHLIGDWEADTIISAGHQSAILSLTEWKSKLTRLRKVGRKSTEAIAQASVALLISLPGRRVHTITSDNGREFIGHEQIAQALSARFYFACPYVS